MPAISDAIREAGSAQQFAENIGVSRRTVFNWLRRGVPVNRVPDISLKTGIPKHVLCPKFWEAPQPERAA